MIASSVIGGIQAKKAAQKAQDELNKQGEQARLDYERRYNQDYTQTAGAQAALGRAREAAADMVRNARGVQAVMGGGNAAVKTAQDAGAKIISDTTASIASQAQGRQDAADSEYAARRDALSGRMYDLYNQRAANSAAAASAGMQAGMGMMGADYQSYLSTGRGAFDGLFNSANARERRMDRHAAAAGYTV